MMTTFIVSGVPSFGQASLLPNLNENDYDSSSEADNNPDSDYSLSDIEECLDDDDPEFEYSTSLDTNSAKHATKNLLPTKKRIRCKSWPCLEALPADRNDVVRRSNSLLDIEKMQNGKSTNYIIRRKSSRLSVRQTTVKNGELKLVHFLKNEKSKLDISVKMTSSDDREKRSDGKNSPEMRLNDRSSPNFDDATKIAKLLEKKDRKQVDSGFIESPTCSEHSRATDDSQSPAKDMQSNDLHAASITSAAVKKWKHYKIAMEAYRKSSGKSPDDVNPGSDGMTSVMSLPARVGKNETKRRSIFNYWDVNLDGSIPEASEKSQTDGSSVNSSESPRESGFFPAQKQDNDDALCFDYRSLLRSKGWKKGHRNISTQLRARDSKRISVDSDIITDIDAMVGFSPTDIIPEPTIKDEEENDSNRNSAGDSQPEKIVWSHYDNYFKQKSDVTYISLNDVNPKRRSGVSTFEAKTRSNTDLTDVLFDSDGVNLRDSKLIRKRNFSSSNLISPTADLPSPLLSALPSENNSHKFHTIASSARLAKLLKRQQRKGSTVRSKEKNPNRFNSISVISSPTNIEAENGFPEPCGKPPLSRGGSSESMEHRRLSGDSVAEEKAVRPVCLNLERRSVNEKKLGRKFRLGSTKSRSLPQLQIIGTNSLTSTPVDNGSESLAFHRSASEKLSADAMLDGMAKMDLNNGAGIFSTLTRRRLSSPFHKKKTFKSSTKRRSIKASDIVHTQLNANCNNNNNNVTQSSFNAFSCAFPTKGDAVLFPNCSIKQVEKVYSSKVDQSQSCLDNSFLQNQNSACSSSICTNCIRQRSHSNLTLVNPRVSYFVNNVTETTEVLTARGNRGTSIRKPSNPLPLPPSPTGVSHHHQVAPPPAISTPQPTSNVMAVKAQPTKDSKKSTKKKKKGKLTKADISMPSAFKHVNHVGFDPKSGYDMNSMDPDVKDLFQSVGVTEEDMEDKEKVDFIYDFIERSGGIQAVKQDQARKSRPPPPGRAQGGAPPPPPPSRAGGAAPPPPSRAVGKAPPPPNRAQGGRMPPPPSHKHSPPAPPPPMSSTPSNAPPPPPPPPAPGPGNFAPPPPPPPSAGGNLMAQISQGTNLRAPSAAPPPAAAPTGRDALLEAIRRGKDLKTVENDSAEEKAAPTSGEGDGLAGALAAALHLREKIIHDSDSDEDEDDDDSDWED